MKIGKLVDEIPDDAIEKRSTAVGVRFVVIFHARNKPMMSRFVETAATGMFERLLENLRARCTETFVPLFELGDLLLRKSLTSISAFKLDGYASDSVWRTFVSPLFCSLRESSHWYLKWLGAVWIVGCGICSLD